MTIWRSPLPAALRHPVISTVTFQVELESFSTSGLTLEGFRLSSSFAYPAFSSCVFFHSSGALLG
jgi:hypothetical protein